tara:strand:+ start:531 stop:947 length:417 start_codon:yes stop_codon:yes gene_type:complete
MIVYGTAEWANVFEPNKMSGKYQMDICQLDKNTVKALQDEGLEIKQGEGEKAHKGFFITAKTKLPPKVMDSQKNIWPSEKLIGNGSKVKVSVNPYSWTFKGKNGISASLTALMVLNLEEYQNSELDAEDGFVLDTDEL